MSGAFYPDFDAGTIVIEKDGRRVLDTAGTLLHFLPTPLSIVDHDFVFPDVTKTTHYIWSWSSTYNGLASPQYGVFESTVPEIAAKGSQDWSADAVLAAVPAGCDLFIGRVSLARTAGPNTNWTGGAVQKRVPESVWIPFSGALGVHLEAAFGFGRTLAIAISGGNLVATIKQSVSVPPGTFGTWGDQNNAVNQGPYQRNGAGGENTATNGVGFPVLIGSAATLSYTANGAGGVGGPALNQGVRPGHPSAPTITDTSNFSSTWRMQLVGRFGCRSTA